MDQSFKETTIWVALGGACGALLRHTTNLTFTQIPIESHFVTATAFENIFGSFLMGYFYSLFTKKKSPNKLRQFMLIGMIGSYTTYSGFGIEAMSLLGESAFVLSGFIFGQVFIGLIALAAGLALGKKF